MWPWDLPLKFQILLGIVAVLGVISAVYAGIVRHRRTRTPNWQETVRARRRRKRVQ